MLQRDHSSLRLSKRPECCLTRALLKTIKLFISYSVPEQLSAQGLQPSSRPQHSTQRSGDVRLFNCADILHFVNSRYSKMTLVQDSDPLSRAAAVEITALQCNPLVQSFFAFRRCHLRFCQGIRLALKYENNRGSCLRLQPTDILSLAMTLYKYSKNAWEYYNFSRSHKWGIIQVMDYEWSSNVWKHYPPKTY